MPTFSGSELLQLLKRVSPDGGETLNDSGSPQFAAFQWLSEAAPQDASDRRLVQLYGLATLYFSTGGNSTWTRTDNWLDTSVSECSWTSNSDSLCVVNSTTVSRLDLAYNNLKGTIPLELALFQDLTRLDLGGGPSEQLTGTIPPTIQTIRGLEELQLRNNLLTGQIPALRQWPRLRTLNLEGNQISGQLPRGIDRLRSLRSFNVRGNNLEGTISQDFRNLASLASLIVSENAFTGELPVGGSRMVRLRSVEASGNQFSSITSSIGELPSLVFFLTQRNQIQGSIPWQFGRLTTLRYLSLADNGFTGSIPSSIGNLRSLIELDLFKNNLRDKIPPELGNLESLRELRLDSNSLTGTIPATFASLARTSTFTFQNNNLSGTVPDEVCVAFGITLPSVFIDCGEVTCDCCNYCCDEAGCTCVFEGTPEEWKCF